MKEKEFRLALDRITQREITKVDLWDNIKAQAVQPSPVRQSTDHPVPAWVRPLVPLSRVAAVLFVFVLVAATGYAVYRLQQPRSGLDGIRTSSLRTPINQSQTIDGVTVTLNWVYADTEQLVMSYSATVLDEAGTPQPIRYKDNEIVYRLKSEEGEWIIPVWSTVWMHGPEREIITSIEWVMENPFPQTFTFELVFNERPLPSQKTDGGQFIVRGDTIPPESTSEPGQMAVPSEGVGPFRFNFNVTPASGVVLKVNQTAADQGYSITLHEIRITPSKAQVSYCFKEDIDGEWGPAFSSLSNETYSSSDMKSQLGDTDCFDASAGLFTPDLPKQLTFQVDAFERTDLTDADWQRIVEGVREKGGRIDYSNGFLHSWDQTLDEVKVELGYRILGDWTITVDVETALTTE